MRLEVAHVVEVNLSQEFYVGRASEAELGGPATSSLTSDSQCLTFDLTCQTRQELND